MIHPKYINRRFPKRRYVLIHRSADFNGRIVGVRYTDGQSAPVEMRRALRIAGAMGSKHRYGFCLDTPLAFGDMSPEERAAALEAGGLVPSREERFGRLVARLRAIKPDDVDADEFEQNAADQLDALLEMDDEEAEHVLDAMAELVAIMEDEQAERTDGDADPDGDADDDDPDAAPDGPQDAEQGDGADGTADDGAGAESATEAGEQPITEPAPADDAEPVEPEGEFAGDDEVTATVAAEPIGIARSALMRMSKAQMDAWAQEHLGMSLDTRQNKADMVDDVLGHERVEEVQG